MGTNSQRPKLEPELNQEVRVRLLKDTPFTGENGYGKYYLYSVQDMGDGAEKAFFAPQDIHDLIIEKRLVKGSEFVLRKVPFQNGKKITSKLELTVISAPPPAAEPVATGSDNLKDLLLQCVKDAADVVRESGMQFSMEETQKLAGTLFIARSKQF